jgi:hypothetical protein
MLNACNRGEPVCTPWNGLGVILASLRMIQQVQAHRHRLQQPQRRRGDGQRQQRRYVVESVEFHQHPYPCRIL